MEHYKMELTQEEKDILEGKQGEVMQKVLKSIVLFGEAFRSKTSSTNRRSYSRCYLFWYDRI